jgi:hypothetical protein
LDSLYLRELHEETTRQTIAWVMKLLEDSDKDVREAAISCLSSLGAQGTCFLVHLEPFLCSSEAAPAELQQEIRPAISGVVKLLEHSNKYVLQAAISCLSSLGAQGMCSLVHLEPFLCSSEAASQRSCSRRSGQQFQGL